MVDARLILVSVLNYGTPEATIQLVHHLSKVHHENITIIVVDNASGDDSIEKFKQALPDVRLIEAMSNNGYAAGHQLSVDYALAHGFDAIWILNPDLSIHAKALEALLHAWGQHGDAIYGSVSLASADDDTIEFAGAHELDGDREVSDYNPYKGKSLRNSPEAQLCRKVTAVEGFSLFVPLVVIRAHGFMDHRYFMYGEETIWCYDLRKKGVPVYIVPESIVYHKGYGSLGEEGSSSAVATYYRMRNTIYWKRKHYGLSWWSVLRRKGGPVAHLKFFVKYLFSNQEWRKQHYRNYLENMAILHALVGIKGIYNSIMIINKR